VFASVGFATGRQTAPNSAHQSVKSPAW